MKKVLVSVVVLSLALIDSSVSAIDVVLSKNNLRLNNDSTSTSFTVTLSDDISALTGSGTIPAKLKLKGKGVTTNLSNNTILIPYTDGVIGTSSEVTFTLASTVNKSSTLPFSISLPGKYRKKYGVSSLSAGLNLDADAVKLSGKVTVPSGDLSNFRARTARKIAQRKAREIAPFNTENPEGVVVELYEINPVSGEPVGEPLAEAITDDDGNYEMEMPAEADFGSNYALIVEGDDGESMHAPLFSDNVPVNPATEALFELTQDAISDPVSVGLPPLAAVDFENFTDTELEGLNTQMEELNPLYEDTLSETVTSLKESYASFLNNMIGFAATEESSDSDTDLTQIAKGIAGDYNVVFFDTSISSSERIGVSMELAMARMSKPDAVGALAVTPFPSFSTQASSFERHNNEHGGDHGDGGCEGSDCGGCQGPNCGHEDDHGEGGCQGPDCGQEGDPGQCEGPDCGQQGDQGQGDQGQGDQGQGDQGGTGSEEEDACYEVEAHTESGGQVNGTDEAGNFYMTIDPSRVISFAEPASEQSFSNGPDGSTSIYRTLPSVMHMIPVGDDMFLSSSTYRGESINSSETLLDYDVGFGSIIKKSELSEGDLDGAYGLVGLGYEVGTSSFSTTSFLGELNFSGNSATFSVDNSYREVMANGCGGSFSLVSGDEQSSGSAQLEFQGDRVSILVDDEDPSSETIFTGFARSDAEILTLGYASDSGAKGSRVDFDGRRRNVIENAERQVIFAVRKPTSLVDLNGKSYRLLSLNFTLNAEGGRILESGDVGTLSFAGGTATVSGFSKTVFTKSTVDSAVETSTVVVNESAISYSLATDGAISMTVGGEQLVGYVSSDLDLMIFNVDEENGLGVYLAVRVD